MDTFQQVLSTIGFVIRAIGFIVLGFGIARFTLDAYYKAVWQVQIALAVGFFLLLVGLTHYSSPASMGMFALGSGAAFVMQFVGKKDGEEEHVKEGKKK
jgi:hypothetical protein